jgi:hypothetical protein
LGIFIDPVAAFHSISEVAHHGLCIWQQLLFPLQQNILPVTLVLTMDPRFVECIPEYGIGKHIVTKQTVSILHTLQHIPLGTSQAT